MSLHKVGPYRMNVATSNGESYHSSKKNRNLNYWRRLRSMEGTFVSSRVHVYWKLARSADTGRFSVWVYSCLFTRSQSNDRLLSNSHYEKPTFDQRSQPMATLLISVFWQNIAVRKIPASLSSVSFFPFNALVEQEKKWCMCTQLKKCIPE